MTDTQRIISSFYGNIEHRDFDAIRRSVHGDMTFSGPVASTDGADAFIEMLQTMTTVTKGFRIHHLFADGDRGCCVYDLLTATPIGESPMAEYFEIRDGRIAGIRSYYDARPWIAMASEGST